MQKTSGVLRLLNMERLHTYPQLNVVYPEKAVFFRLGGNVALTELSDAEHARYSKLAAEAYTLCHPQGRWMIKKTDSIKDGAIYFTDGNILHGKMFADRLSEAGYVWFAAVTVGGEIVEARDSLNDISAAAVYDAVASEMADETMDMLQKMTFAHLSRFGGVLGHRRYSPGYGDMPLEEQKVFYRILEMQDMGITLTENCFMIPEKSVTAVAPVMLQKQ